MKFLLFLSEAAVPLMIFYMTASSWMAGRPLLDDFIHGTQKGMKTVWEVFPSLLGLMTAVGVLRASGFLDFLSQILTGPAALFHMPSQLVPVVLVRLVSNSAAMGLVTDLFSRYGPDSLIGLAASILMSSTETLLYCMSIYFGPVKIRRTGYTLAGALLGTGAGVAVSLILAYALV